MLTISKAHRAHVAEKEVAVAQAYTALVRETRKQTNSSDARQAECIFDFLSATDAWVDAYVHPPSRKKKRLVNQRLERTIRASVHFTSGLATATGMPTRRFLAVTRSEFPFLSVTQ
jgi:hypothetical protein